MGNKRKKKFNKNDVDQPNLKRFRNDLMKLSSDGSRDEGDHKQEHHAAVEMKAPKVNRKQRRKEERKMKKARRLAHSIGKKMPNLQEIQSAKKLKEKDTREKSEMERKEKLKKKKEVAKEKRKQKLEEQKAMEADRRKEALREENKREEKMLKHLEKQLHMNRRKSKSLPKSFLDDGLDYLLDVVDEDKISELYNDKGSESDLDLEGMEKDDGDEILDEDDEETGYDSDDNKSDDKTLSKVDRIAKTVLKLTGEKDEVKQTLDRKQGKKVHFDIKDLSEEEEKEGEIQRGREKMDEDDDDDDEEEEEEEEESFIKEGNEEEEEDDDDDDDDNDDDDDRLKPKTKEKDSMEPVLKEDIYGRLRDEEGNIVHNALATGKYIPPGKRLQPAEGDQKKKLQLERLRKQLKGLVNRASESNMQGICSQIEAVYLGNSRADVTETLTSIILEAVISATLTPERLVMELVMLITVLHGNVGNEVGATFLEFLAHKFDKLCNHGNTYGEGKEMDNVVLLFCHLYNFKVIQSLLILDVIRKFITSFKEKDVELLLLILKNVGFTLRKDDPIALKDIILEIQSKAAAMDTSQAIDQSRVRFMLDTLLAIKNNNMRKIPNYDPELIEQLKKSTRNVLRGNSLGDGQLRIELDDLLHAENKGKWWIVGSAWEGRGQGQTSSDVSKVATSVLDGVSAKILELAQKQRMNTDVRRNIFCVMITSEDYVDAFEKLMQLGLKNKQEREIIHVIIDSCQQEKSFNPFYALLLQKFCECDRRFQMTFQFTMWDKFKEMTNLTEQSRINLAKLVVHLLSTKAQSLSLFKVVEFGTLDTAMVRFMKEVLIGLLLDQSEEACESVFLRIAPLSKLQMLQEGLKLFMQHFLLRKKAKDIPSDPKLKDRVELAIKALSAGQSKMLL